MLVNGAPHNAPVRANTMESWDGPPPVLQAGVILALPRGNIQFFSCFARGTMSLLLSFRTHEARQRVAKARADETPGGLGLRV